MPLGKQSLLQGTLSHHRILPLVRKGLLLPKLWGPRAETRMCTSTKPHHFKRMAFQCLIIWAALVFKCNSFKVPAHIRGDVPKVPKSKHDPGLRHGYKLTATRCLETFPGLQAFRICFCNTGIKSQNSEIFFLTNISKSYKHLKEIQNKIHMNVLVFKKQSLYLTAHSFSLRENLKIHQTCFLIV